MDPEKTTNSHDPVARIKDIEARARQRSRPCREQAVLVPDGQENPMPANVVKLPLWPETVRAVPNGFLRSALFGAIGKGRRRYINGEDLGIGGLDQDAGAIAEQGIISGGAAMLEISQDLQTLLDDGVAFPVLDVDDEADAAGIMFVGWVIQTLLLREDHLYFLDTSAKIGFHGTNLLRPVSRSALLYLVGIRAAVVKKPVHGGAHRLLLNR